jgi:hypothetical protein
MFAKLINDGTAKASLKLAADHALYNSDGMYSLAALRDYHYTQAKEIGDKFDQRNGNTGYAKELDAMMGRA